ncbi:hypothetical protein [Pseudocitrobacter cyperus]|uniref:Uncharacterized protein n=1 Tax=Pseudocitrobacter cyperus TaxID=3112843 RepID=A0ABV0HG09_9ENTR
MMKNRILISVMLFGIFSVSSVSAETYNEAIKSRYIDSFFRKLSAQEITKLESQNTIKALSCDEYFNKGTESISNRIFSIDQDDLLRGKKVMPQGKVICLLIPSGVDKKEGNIVVREMGMIGDRSYEVSSIGNTFLGDIGGISLTCDMSGPWEDVKSKVSVSFKGCFIEVSHLTIQRVPELKSIDIPNGHLISLGAKEFYPLISIKVDGEEFKTKSGDPFFTGKDAERVINAMSQGENATYQFSDYFHPEAFEEAVDYYQLPKLKSAIEVMDSAYNLFK